MNESGQAPAPDATPRQVAESYWRAEAERDVDKVALHYHPDATFHPPGGVKLVGWDQIRPWYEATYARFPEVRVDIVHEISSGDEACFEFQATLTDEDGTVHRPTGVNVVKVEGGKYREVRAYFDPTVLG